MDSVLFNQRTKELASAKTPEAQALFEEQERLRVFALTDEETEAELAFLEQELLAIKAEVKAYLAGKLSLV
jgi:hypothetical protein